MEFHFFVFLLSFYFLRVVNSLGSPIMMSVPPCPPSSNIQVPSVNNLPCYLPVPQNSIYYIALQIPGGSNLSPIVVNFLLNISLPCNGGNDFKLCLFY